MRKLAFHAIAASVLALCNVDARADAVQFLGYAHGSVPIDFHLSGTSSTNGSTNAGGFITQLNGMSSTFTTYCIDLFQYISFNQPPYTDYSVVGGGSFAFRNSNANKDLRKLYAAGHAVNDAVTEGAFQLAVWEIVYETSGVYALGGANKGDAWFDGGNGDTQAARTLATAWLGQLAGTDPDGWKIHVLKSPTLQDEIFATHVPEPGTAALALAALGVMGWAGRRGRSR